MDDFKPIEIGGRSLENRILIGLAAITATIILVGWIAINENARMEEFTERTSARSIEQGGKLYENNCSTCHGPASYGSAGVAPALNSPVFFGFSFFAEIDQQLIIIESQLGNATGEERAQLQARQAELQAERVALEEKILYDYTREVAHLEEQVTALDEQIAANLEGVGTGSRLAAVIDRFKVAQQTPLEDEIAALEAAIEAAATPAPAAESSSAEAATEPEAAATEAAVVVETAPAATEPEADAAEETVLDCAFLQGDVRMIDTVVAQVVDQTNLDQLNARLAEVEAKLAQVEDCIKPYEDLATQRSTLTQQQGRFQAVMDAQAAVTQARTDVATAESALAALPTVEAGATDANAEERTTLTQQSADASTALSTAEANRDAAYQALVDEGDVVAYDPDGDSRLQQVGWPGSLEDYIEGTLIGGRPTSSAYWPNAMAAWAQSSGGPLRPDQIKNLTNYILNFGRNWQADRPVDEMIAELRHVKQYARIPTATDAPVSSGESMGTDELAIQTEITTQTEAGTITPDAAAGEEAFAARGCAGCHGAANGTGPAVTGLWGRAQDDLDGRLTSTNHVDNPEAYVIQSIVNPGAFTVPGFTAGLMPSNFSEVLSYQELANILAYLETQD